MDVDLLWSCHNKYKYWIIQKWNSKDTASLLSGVVVECALFKSRVYKEAWDVSVPTPATFICFCGPRWCQSHSLYPWNFLLMCYFLTWRYNLIFFWMLNVKMWWIEISFPFPLSFDWSRSVDVFCTLSIRVVPSATSRLIPHCSLLCREVTETSQEALSQCLWTKWVIIWAQFYHIVV